ncbi:MAG: hypothetical protein R3248_12350 [Candidatus Promineifilaceae bacterium]|nr:hypothetical protein [Candidatus Promineifilaceae bacterium]
MSHRKSRKTGNKRRKKKASSQGESTGWGSLNPKIAITGIIVVSVFSAGNVLFALYKEGVDVGTMILITFLALVTPGLAAALVYYIRKKLSG